MPFDLKRLLDEHQGQNFELFAAHVNPQFARVLRTIGYDRFYTRAEGAYLYDERGRQYLDFLGGYAVCNVGRNHPAVKKALLDYLAMDAAGMVQFDAPLLAGILARELKRRCLFDLEFAFFTNSGTEGIEAAVKFARCATGRAGLVSTDHAFHGLTTGSLALNGCESFREGFGPLLPGCTRVPFGDVQALDAALRGGTVAALVLEPVQGKGVNIAPAGYLAEAHRLCKRYGTLLVMDEVQTGVGRCGTFLGVHAEPECTPDMVVMSKALSGGYVPVGAVLVRGDVWRRVFSSMDRAIVHSSTFHMGGLAMTAALAVLDVYDDQRLGPHSARMGRQLLDGMRALQARFELVKEVRGLGLMCAMEFGEPRSLSLRAAWKLVNAMNENLFAQAAVIPLFEDHGVLCQVAGHGMPTVKFTPPLVVQPPDVERMLAALECVLERMHRFPGPALDVMHRLGKNAVLRRSYEQAAADPAMTVL
ncbi:MAG: aspartate aminotransferase family protein [Phycisphaerae bacterium]|nr:aspartate aminotransferase family protein [Phycisphaerae bacterium]